jgi:hypothetical protein
MSSIVRDVKGSLQLRPLSEQYAPDIMFFIVPKRGLYRYCVVRCCGVLEVLSCASF